MNTPFVASHGPILIDATIWGPAGSRSIRVALDTGATRSLIRESVLAAIGIVAAPSGPTVQVTMSNSVQTVPLVEVDRIEALGKSRDRLLVTAHTLPQSAGVEGLLGLDFLRLRRLTVDFRRGYIGLV